MTSSSMWILCGTLIAHIFVGDSAVQIEYNKRVASDHKSDGFAMSLSTSNGKLVIGAPYDNHCGSVTVEDGVRINGPPQGISFGMHVVGNQQFIVVSGSAPDAVYVYESTSHYNLKATLPVDGRVKDVGISEDSTIAVIDGKKQVGWL